MKIKLLDIPKYLLLIVLGLIVLSPALSYQIGIPRLDSGLSFIFVLLSIIALCVKAIETNFLKFILFLYGIFFFGFLSVITHFSADKIIDLFFFGIIIFIFHYSFLSSLSENRENEIRRILLILSTLVILGFMIEAVLGIQLVSGNDELTVENNAFKGFFFNTNDQATVVISLASAVGFFYLIRETSFKTKLIGYFLLLIIGAVVIVSASRTVLFSYLLMFILILFLNATVYFKILYLFLGSILILFIFNLSWLEELFNLLAKIEWLARPIERFSLAIFSLDDDQSVGYRTEIYTGFIDNFKLLWIGYGPRDYINYFDDVKLSLPLGYTNPHSFFIEIYLAFGLFAFIIFIFFLLYSIYYILKDKYLRTKEKTFILFIFLNFCWIVWVPSSIFRLPLVWYPIFLVLIYTILNRSSVKNRNNL
jgi:O-Antigen ligase.